MSKLKSDAAKAIFGLIWCSIVIFSYYYENTGYYAEKVSVFGKFLSQVMGF